MSQLNRTKLNRALKLTTYAGTGAAVWYLVCTPQAIFNVFFTNYLGASSAQLGLLVGIMQACGLFHLVSIFVYGKLDRRKPFWIVFHTLHRVSGLVMAWICLTMARQEDKSAGILIITAAVAISFVFANMSASGWWGWIADLVPEKIRATYFGKRSSVMNIVNIACFLTVTIVLDTLTGINPFYIFGTVFLIAGIVGILDPLVHILVPEPRSDEKEEVNFSEFIEPLKNRNFMLFSIAVGVALFSIQVFAPFSAPYITSASEIGAPNTWVGIMFVISQLTWVLVAPSWGLVMDRFGRRPVVMMGLGFTLSWVGYLFLTPENYTYLLPLMAITAGLTAPGFWEGVNQLMLSLTPNTNRISYVAWYNTIVGLVSAGGAYAGGFIKDQFQSMSIQLMPGITFKSIHLILVISFGLIGISQLLLSRIIEARQQSLGYVIGQIARPTIFRTLVNVGVLGSPAESTRVARTLRSLEGSTEDIMVEEVIGRLEDPSSDVREEAARALGRIGNPAAVDALIDQLTDPDSTVRTQAARALGQIGDTRALPYLIDSLYEPSEDLQDASAQALGSIGNEESVSHLLRLFKDTRSDRVVAAGAEAASRLGILEAGWEIVPRMHQTSNPVLRRQLAIAFGNTLGRPGDFYKLISGNLGTRDAHIRRMFQDAQKGVRLLISQALKDKAPLQDVKRISIFTGKKGTAAAKNEAAFNNNDATSSAVESNQNFPMEQSETIMPLHSLKSIRGFFADEHYSEALEELFGLANYLMVLFHGPGLGREEYLDASFKREAKLGLWWWFITEVQNIASEMGDELRAMDVLLGVFYLASLTGKQDNG